MLRTLAIFILAVALPAAEAPLEPFVLPWDDATPSVVSCRDGNAPPAGASGPVGVDGQGHFSVGGRRIRFLGVNLAFGANLPTPEQAQAIAGRLAKFGVNIVRIHHLDSQPWPAGIRVRGSSTRDLAPEALDRLDHLAAALQRHGIYLNLNLLVGRPFSAADGLPAEIESLSWKDRAVPGFFVAPMLELQKDYARRLLGRRNGVTGVAWATDPALACVEIHNENGLFQAWHGGELDRLPGVFREDLRRQWNAWLAARYPTTAALAAAWSAGIEPLGTEMLGNPGWNPGLTGWNLEQHHGAQATATPEDALPPELAASGRRSLRVTVTRPGREDYEVQVNQGRLAITAGRTYTLEVWLKSDVPRTVHVGLGQHHAPWHGLGPGLRAAVGPSWQRFRTTFAAIASDDDARVGLSGLGQAAGSTWIAGPSLRPGGMEGLGAGERLEDASVAALARDGAGRRSAAAQGDWCRFLWDTEDRYWQEMRRFLVEDLHVQAPVLGTIVGCSTPNLQARLDAVDGHAYWNHPHFPGKPWDPEDWTVANRSLVDAPAGGILGGLAVRRVLGRPFTVSEYNHPAPNPHGAEGFLLLAAYAAFQDWDAIYAYSYAHSAETFATGYIHNFFDIGQHPLKMASLIPARALFIRGDVQTGRQVVAVGLDQEREIDLLRNSRAWDLLAGQETGLPPALALRHRLGLVVQGRAQSIGASPPPPVVDLRHQISDTGELTWDRGDGSNGLVTVNAPRSKAVIGHGGGRTITLGPVAISPGSGRLGDWSCLTVTILGDGPAFTEPGPRRILITALGEATSTGMAWKDASRTSVGRQWGRAPALVEVVPATVSFPWPAAQVQAWALDPRGQRAGTVAVTGTGTTATLQLGGTTPTIWYEVEIR